MLDAAIARQPRLPRFLCHIFQRLTQHQLNLVTGAGISMEAGVPGWTALLERLAAREDDLKQDLGQHSAAGLHPEYLGQIIYHRFKNSSPSTEPEELRAAVIEHGWGAAIHKAIYQDTLGDIEKILEVHPYLVQLRDLSRKLPLVINFNFDDLLAEAIGSQIKSEDSDGNSLTITWNAPLVDRKGNTTIYHVNGILPRISLRKRSPQIIFTEDSFAAARARAPGLSAEYLFLRFVQNTMLLVGHSLADSSLKNYLRMNRDKSPANHHYMIHWLKNPSELSSSRQRDIFEANLELYNLVTIFLTSTEISQFLQILNMGSREFRDLLESLGSDRRSRYHYYIVGPVASGKSSLLEQLRCFQTHEEWTRPPPNEMYLASTKINDSQREIVDKFVYSELKEKNNRMHSASAGFHFMDRAPLDLYAFSRDESENSEKSQNLRDIVIRDRSLKEGEIIFIEASPQNLVKRNMARGRAPEDAGTEEYFQNQTRILNEIYTPNFRFSTDQCSSDDLARRVARHVLLGEYCPVDLDGIIARYA
ncbi:SIR2 family protein [Bosea sp. Root483D1]|uniref:SIR2 family protein n=1 Tax=Bosea sp. Root483D1 TaxID=1736544 RepID=UPI0009EBDF0E|nr:SIR2 family protein [Bosea sp. Root483D1]